MNRLAHMYLANNNVAPRDDTQLQQWLDIADAAHNSTPTLSGYSPHELLTGQQRLLSLASLVPDDLLAALGTSLGSPNWTPNKTIADSVRLHRAALSVLDEARAQARLAARLAARTASEKAYGQRHAGPRVFQVGDLVVARIPPSERDISDKVNKRLAFSGIWRVAKVNPDRESYVIRLLFPVTTYSDKANPPIEVDKDITVHAEDLRDFIEGAPMDSDNLATSFNPKSPLGTAWFTSPDSPEHVAAVKAAVNRQPSIGCSQSNNKSASRASSTTRPTSTSNDCARKAPLQHREHRPLLQRLRALHLRLRTEANVNIHKIIQMRRPRLPRWLRAAAARVARQSNQLQFNRFRIARHQLSNGSLDSPPSSTPPSATPPWSTTRSIRTVCSSSARSRISATLNTSYSRPTRRRERWALGA